jgi:hypothetical protein
MKHAETIAECGAVPGRIGTMILVLWLSSSCVVSSAPADEQRTISATYAFEAPQLESRGDYTRLTEPGCGQLHRIGEPAMPFRTARLLIPSGFTAEKVDAVPSTEPVKIQGHWRIEYAGQPSSRPALHKLPFAPGDSQRIYASDVPYPASAAELISVQRMAGYDIALVRVFPVQYKPASSQLLFAAKMTLNLHLAPAHAPAGAEPPVRPPMLKQAANRVASFVDNPAMLQSPSEAPAGVPVQAYDYLLITSDKLVPAFQPLVERKTQDGLAVRVVTMETITNTVPGRDVPEMVRNYIRQAYTNWGISYVLLGGSTTIVPTRTAYVRAGLQPADSYLPTDLYYACLDGSWNGNGDRHWGEPTDGEGGGDVDLLAEVYVGRAPVTTEEQAATFVEKTVRYETEGNANTTNALLMATFLGDFPTGPCQGSDMYKPLRPLLGGFQSDILDDQTNKYPQWSRVQALRALNRSPHLVFYNGHGRDDILMRMHSADLKGLTNEWPFLVCSVGCSAAEFDHGKFWPDSFGETLINGSRHGAFAAVLNARAGWFDPQYPWKYSGEFQAKFFEELIKRGHANLGLANQHAKEDLIGQVESSGDMTYRWCYYGITLLGDPQLPFHLQSPADQGRSTVRTASDVAAPTPAKTVSASSASTTDATHGEDIGGTKDE